MYDPTPPARMTIAAVDSSATRRSCPTPESGAFAVTLLTSGACDVSSDAAEITRATAPRADPASSDFSDMPQRYRRVPSRRFAAPGRSPLELVPEQRDRNDVRRRLSGERHAD